ncbi:MAG TPA: hypothetical protein DCW86_01035 [Actinobacteria bacterium]|nr:hypothetical protein [Actinomycetota bacterium]
MSQTVKGLSKAETRLLSILSKGGKNIFSFEDAFRILGISRNHAWKFVHTLVDKGWLKTLEKGKYLIVPFEAGPEGQWSEEAFVVASYLINPYAISYWSALNHYGYTEQIPRTIFISTTKRRFKAEIEVLGVPYKFVTLKKHKFFGIEKTWIANKQINITDKEKTIVDCLDHPEYCGGIIEAAKGLYNGMADNVDLDKITSCAQEMGNKAIFKRLGYLAEVLELPVGTHIAMWQERISAGYALLDPTLGGTGKHNSRWNLRLNVAKRDLTSWRMY